MANKSLILRRYNNGEKFYHYKQIRRKLYRRIHKKVIEDSISPSLMGSDKQLN